MSWLGRPWARLILCAAGLCLALSGCAGSVGATGVSGETPAARATTPAGLTRPGAPAAFPTAHPPAPGTVDRAGGPFDDRFTMADLTLGSGGVAGALTVTSDVSELIVLEVHAGFFDRAGGLLGTQVKVHRDDHADARPHSEQETVEFDLTPDPAYAARVSSARVWVPVLVNE